MNRIDRSCSEQVWLLPARAGMNRLDSPSRLVVSCVPRNHAAVYYTSTSNAISLRPSHRALRGPPTGMARKVVWKLIAHAIGATTFRTVHSVE